MKSSRTGKIFEFFREMTKRLNKYNFVSIINRQPRLETLWISHQPNLHALNVSLSSPSRDSNKMSFLYTRGAYVIKLSHSGDLLALACNQKYVEQNCLLFMSPSNGSILPVNLRNFGLNAEARGRFVQNFNNEKISFNRIRLTVRSVLSRIKISH